MTLLAACAPSSVRTRGLVPARSTAEALATALEPRRIAVVTGVDAYDDPAFPDLVHAGDDATALAEVFRSARGGGFDEVVLLKDATRAELFDALRVLGTSVRRNDQVVVYFSGHGTRVPDGDRWRRFLLGRDSRPDDLETSAVDLDALTHWFGQLPAQRKALVVDACFDGDGKSVVRPAQREGPAGDSLIGAAPVSIGEVRMFATSAGRPSLEDDKLGHGVYTYYVLEALGWGFREADRDEDGVVTAWEAHDHARQATLRHTDGRQVPEAALRVLGEGDLVLAGQPDARRRRERALVYLYPTGQHELDGVEVLVDGRTRGSLPGTLPLAPGRHHIVMARPDGRLVAEGYASFAAGHTYRADVVSRLMEGPRFGVTVQPVWVTSPALEFAIGPGAGALEVGVWHRDDDPPGRNQVAALTLGLGSSPGRPTLDTPRSMGWLTFEGGFQGDWRWTRTRLTWTLSGVLVPPSWGPDGKPGAIDPTTVPDRAGWVFGTTGPSLRTGVVLSEVWTAHALVRPSATWLRLPDRPPGLVPWVTAGVGVDAVF
ncbi:MAG: caspase family protein [Alphaproteobacteria bacterium]|nr:caspase family protein [Alphaproteobacteria bacterium]